jgi:Kef-type K+ transport system membrane component KefB
MVDTLLLLLLLFVAFIATLISTKLGISVAIIEITLGIILGNYIGIKSADHDWMLFLAGLGSVVLTFLSGAEIDPEAMKKTWKANLSIGTFSFLAPFLGAMAFTYSVLGWAWEACLLSGVALSTTSVAVVYVVLVEAGKSKTETGKLILSACFITDLGTAIALSALFITPNYYIVILIAAIIVTTLFVPRGLRWLLAKLKRRGGEPEVKLILFLVVALGACAEVAGVHAVLPAYVLGLVAANVLSDNKEVLMKVRTVALAFLTPFFFINAGVNISLDAVVAGAALIAILFAVKIIFKFVGVYPLSRKFVGKNSLYTHY